MKSKGFKNLLFGRCDLLNCSSHFGQRTFALIFYKLCCKTFLFYSSLPYILILFMSFKTIELTPQDCDFKVVYLIYNIQSFREVTHNSGKIVTNITLSDGSTLNVEESVVYINSIINS